MQISTLLIWLLWTQSQPATQPASTQPVTTQPAMATQPADAAKVLTVQPGVRIDWNRRVVEVDAVVILREGLLELLACSPRIREHESILRIEARPLHVFQALGLIGLSPGRPASYDADTNESRPATGDRIEVLLRYQTADGEVTEPAERWLKRVDSTQPLDALPWVFAGSQVLEDGSFAADREGTVIAVVDFPSALIALAEVHSSSNDALWLEPRTVAIPAAGQRCVLLLQAGPKLVRVDAGGRIYWEDRPVTLGVLMATLMRGAHEAAPPRVALECDPQCPAAARKGVIAMLQHCVPNFAADKVRTVPVQPPKPPKPTTQTP